MKNLKKGILSTLLGGTIVLTSLVACGNVIHYEPQICNIDIELTSSRVAFSNWTLSSSQGATYSLNVSGDTQNGDLIVVSIGKQTCDGNNVNYIKLSDKSIIHRVTNSETNLTLFLNNVFHEKNDVFLLDFSLIFQIVRNNKTIAKREMENFVFVNGTPTPAEFFDTTKSDDGLKVNGFARDGVVAEQLKLCNIFVLPQGTTVVESEAFEGSPIPPWIQRVYLDYSELDSSYEPTLERILPRAFVNTAINNEIILPSTLGVVGSNAFMGCTGVSAIELHRQDVAIGQLAFGNIPGATELDVSIYDNVESFPKNWSSACFSKSEDIGNSMICYYNSAVNKQDWTSFLGTLNINLSNWSFECRNEQN